MPHPDPAQSPGSACRSGEDAPEAVDAWDRVGASLTFEQLVGQQFACPPPVAAEITARARARPFSAAAILLRQGEETEEAFLLLLGRARAALLTQDGRLLRLLDYGPGDLFGAIGDISRPSGEVSANEAGTAAVFSAGELFALAERHSCVGILLSRSLIRQLALLSQQLVATLTLTATGRVQAELLRLARTGDGRRIAPIPVFAELALSLQTTRETVSRTVSALERRGMLRRETDVLVIVAPQRFEASII